MATTRRPEDPDVASTPVAGQTLDLERWPIAADLDREPYRFEFFQAVRLLQLMYPHRQVVGRFSNPQDEVARFGANASVVFPASEIQTLKRPSTGPIAILDGPDQAASIDLREPNHGHTDQKNDKSYGLSHE